MGLKNPCLFGCFCFVWCLFLCLLCLFVFCFVVVGLLFCSVSCCPLFGLLEREVEKLEGNQTFFAGTRNPFGSRTSIGSGASQPWFTGNVFWRVNPFVETRKWSQFLLEVLDVVRCSESSGAGDIPQSCFECSGSSTTLADVRVPPAFRETLSPFKSKMQIVNILELKSRSTKLETVSQNEAFYTTTFTDLFNQFMLNPVLGGFKHGVDSPKVETARFSFGKGAVWGSARRGPAQVIAMAVAVMAMRYMDVGQLLSNGARSQRRERRGDGRAGREGTEATERGERRETLEAGPGLGVFGEGPCE